MRQPCPWSQRPGIRGTRAKRGPMGATGERKQEEKIALSWLGRGKTLVNKKSF